MIKFKKEIKELLTTWQGWAAWIIANIITSLHWAIPALLAVVFQDSKLYVLSGTLWALGISPFIPLFVINIFLSVWIKNLLLKKGRSIPEQRTDQKGRTNQ
jgi:hypothetical protein